MGYTTDFEGKISVTPALNADEVSYLRDFAESRRMNRDEGPYFVKGIGGPGPGVIDHNYPDPSQPGLWCQWVPTDDGSAIEWDGVEKFYNAQEWMTYVIGLISQRPDAFEYARMIEADERFARFTFDHVLDGQIDAQGGNPEDRWRLIVTDNEVTRQNAVIAWDSVETPDPALAEIAMLVNPRVKDAAVVTFARPGRIEVAILDGVLHAFVYDGALIDIDQEPMFAYDGTLPENVNCSA